jgi:polyvinyl alcohol dehydrogenase (cytochrome)
MLRTIVSFVSFVLGAGAWSGLAYAQTPAAPDGEALYKQRCSMCHDAGLGHVPSRASLGRRSTQTILVALRVGAMKSQATGLSGAELVAIASFLTAEAAAKAVPLKANFCTTAATPLSLSAESWNGWGRDPANTRYQPNPGLDTADVPRLKLKWAFAYPGQQTWGQPTVVGSRVFVSDPIGSVYALDAKTGCTVWKANFGAATRNALSVGPGPKGGPRAVAYFGDQAAVVHAVDAEDGHELWSSKVDNHPQARVTGSPALAGDRLLVPVSSLEEGAAISPTYACCTFRGSVAALDTRTGKVLWQTRTIDQPLQAYHRQNNPIGLFGPAGASVWHTPTVDLEHGVVYVGTGNNYTDIEVPTTNSIMALELKTGKVRWARQLLPHDHWTAGCILKTACPDNAGPDYDFAVSPVLITLPTGRKVVVAGQKSGEVYGLDPGAQGKVLWKTRVGTGSSLGGIEWGMTAIGSVLYVPISDSKTMPVGAGKPGLGAIDVASGRVVWWTPASQPVCAWGESECRNAHSQAPSAIPGVVFSGSQDGLLQAYDATTGAIVWSFDTGREVHPVNAASASGGSLDSGGPTVAAGMLFVNSGYGQMIGMGGNVLLAFSVEGQ